MFGFLITAYKAEQQAADNIRHIRNTLGEFANSPILLATTAECGMPFEESKSLGAWIMNYMDAPGSSTATWFKSKSNLQEYAAAGDPWRAEFLTARIFFTMYHALREMYIQGIRQVLHLHTDSFWKSEKVLRDDLNNLITNRRLFIGDTTMPCERDNILPPGFCFQPEGMLLNLVECNRTGFWNFPEMYYSVNSRNKYLNERQFHSPDWIGFEPTIGCWAHYKLFNRNITGPCDIPDAQYYEKVIRRHNRTYHGDFGHIDNIAGAQPNG